MKSLNQEKNKKYEFIGNLIGYTIGSSLVGFIFLWYNYVWLHKNLSFWQAYILGLVIVYLVKTTPWIIYISHAVFAATLIIQTLSWINIITLPIFK